MSWVKEFENEKVLCIYHRKDFDGIASGALINHMIPHAKMKGWDYEDPQPYLSKYQDHAIIIVDVSLADMFQFVHWSHTVLWMDHHISSCRDFLEKHSDNPHYIAMVDKPFKMGVGMLNYIYDPKLSACEIAYKTFFPDEAISMPYTLLGRYDTWRQDEGDWENETLPFQYGMRLLPLSINRFPQIFLPFGDRPHDPDIVVRNFINDGRAVLKYQAAKDAASMKNSFVADVNIPGNRVIALVCNGIPHTSKSFDSRWDPHIHDVMIAITFDGVRWAASIYGENDKIDCSAIAKHFGGGGHMNAAGCHIQELSQLLKL